MKQKSKLFHLGEKIEIIRKQNYEDKYYPSQILDIVDDDTFIINGPISKNSLVFLRVGEVIEISCTKENKGQYKFRARVLDRKLDQIYSIKIKRIGCIEKLQKREFYRFDTNIDVEKHYDTKDDEVHIEDCVTRDISGNGMQLMCNYSHSVDDKILCEFKIKNHKLSIPGRVVRIEEIDTLSYKYAMGIQFIDIDDNERDIIVRYIFDKERELRSKGLI